MVGWVGVKMGGNRKFPVSKNIFSTMIITKCAKLTIFSNKLHTFKVYFVEISQFFT